MILSTRKSLLIVMVLGTTGLLNFFATATYANPSTSIDIGGGNRLYLQMKSFKALRDEHLVRQSLDFSCGAAALATLFTYYLKDKTSEWDILGPILYSLKEDEEALRKKQGLSLLDLQMYTSARGYQSEGFRVSPNYLEELNVPVIAFVAPGGYKHFVVLKRTSGDYVYVADPSRGNLQMPKYKFLEMWKLQEGKGVIFVVQPREKETQSILLKNLPNPQSLQPETLGLRQMLEMGNPYFRFLQLKARFPELGR